MMRLERKYIIGIASFILFLIIFLLSNVIFNITLKVLPFIFVLAPFFLLLKKKNRGKKNLHSESILQKRIKKFKSIKRGYYSLVILITYSITSYYI